MIRQELEGYHPAPKLATCLPDLPLHEVRRVLN